MKRVIASVVCMLGLWSAAGQEKSELSPEDALARLVSYGIINESPEDEHDDSVEILQHYAKLRNGDEEIGDFPYCVRLIEAGGTDNRLPVSCLKPFVRAGATVQGQEGDTSPLQAAAEAGNEKVAAYLLEAGADVHYLDAELRTALDYALSGELRPEHYATIRLILSHNALPTPHAMLYATLHDPDLLRELVSHGGSMSPEVVNAAVWNADSLEYLLSAGAYLHGMEESGLNVTRALLLRISTGKWQAEELSRIVDILVQHHAPFYTHMPEEELLLFLPEQLPPALHSRLLALYTTKPLPSFPETDESDVEEVE